jgi:mono/diheme cytochrome c family protein
VLVRGDELFVTRFRAAQLLVLNKDGVLQETRTPRSFGHDEKRFVQEDGANNACGKFVSKIVHVEATPNVAWRAIDVPMSGVTMLHQRSRTDEIQVTAGGYGSRSSCGSGIVQTSVTAGLDSQNAPTADMGDLTLAVDIAADPEGNLLAIAAPGNHGVLSQVQLIPLTQLQAAADVAAPADIDAGVAFPSAGSFASPMVPGQDFAPCMSGSLLPDATRQVTAVSFASAHVLAVQEREPAAITFYDLRTHSLRTRVELGGESRLDTGHTIFHVRTGAGLACASCHPEAGDDGLVWTFATIGARRTQTLRGGLLGTEPLHWNGDMDNFEKLVKEVFVGRMSGFAPSAQQSDALSHWLDLQPSLHADAADVAAAQRGKELFESQEVRCSQCHAGSNLTNNQSEDVGTGAKLQVPSLKGVRFRAPLMHDGCAGTISERFTNKQCGGGDSHGVTSQLSTAQISDLVAYLETL